MVGEGLSDFLRVFFFKSSLESFLRTQASPKWTCRLVFLGAAQELGTIEYVSCQGMKTQEPGTWKNKILSSPSQVCPGHCHRPSGQAALTSARKSLGF